MAMFLGGFVAGAVVIVLAIVAFGVWAMRSGGRADLYDFGYDPRTDALASGATTPEQARALLRDKGL